MGDTHMHCWKTINVKKQYGADRLFFISALIGAAVFTSYYMLLAIAYAEPLSDQNFMLFADADFQAFAASEQRHKMQ